MLIVHILSAIYFGVGALLATIFSLQVPYTPTLAAKARKMGQSSRVALAMIVPGVVISGITGLILDYQEKLTFGTHWVLISLIVYIIIFVLGAAAGPMTARTRRLAESEARAGKKPSPEIIHALRSPTARILNGVTIVLTLFLVYLMFAKSGAPFAH